MSVQHLCSPGCLVNLVHSKDTGEILQILGKFVVKVVDRRHTQPA
jgi:hypothetical protein